MEQGVLGPKFEGAISWIEGLAAGQNDGSGIHRICFAGAMRVCGRTIQHLARIHKKD